MRKIFTLFVILFVAASSVTANSKLNTSPRSMGFRIGATGFDASYQHIVKKNQFVQGDFGVDFGYNAKHTNYIYII